MKTIAIPIIVVLITIIVIYTVLVHLINWIFRDGDTDNMPILSFFHLIITMLTIGLIHKLF